MSSQHDDMMLLIEERLPEIVPSFFNEQIKGDGAVKREVYVEYLSALLHILDEAGCPLNLSFPLAIHIAHLKDLNTGNTADYLEAKKVNGSPPKEVMLKQRDLFISVALNILMEEKKEEEASRMIAKWCSDEKIDIGGRMATTPSNRIKTIRNELTKDPALAKQYLKYSTLWQKMGKTREEAAFKVLKFIKLSS